MYQTQQKDFGDARLSDFPVGKIERGSDLEPTMPIYGIINQLDGCLTSIEMKLLLSTPKKEQHEVTSTLKELRDVLMDIYDRLSRIDINLNIIN